MLPESEAGLPIGQSARVHCGMLWAAGGHPKPLNPRHCQDDRGRGRIRPHCDMSQEGAQEQPAGSHATVAPAPLFPEVYRTA